MRISVYGRMSDSYPGGGGSNPSFAPIEIIYRLNYQEYLRSIE